METNEKFEFYKLFQIFLWLYDLYDKGNLC